MHKNLFTGAALALAMSWPAVADWSFNGQPNPNAFIQTGDVTLELQCDRVRFAPAGYEDAEDIATKQGLSFRFMENGSTEVGAFQAGPSNADISIVDNYPVEVRFFDQMDYDFILEQIAQNAALNLSMIDQDVSYVIFTLSGSGTAVKSLRSACASGASSSQDEEAPEGIVYCGGGGVKRMIEYAIMGQSDEQWDAVVTVNGNTIRAMTANSYFGKSQPPEDFKLALLGEDRSEFLVFSNANRNWIEFGDYTYEQCN